MHTQDHVVELGGTWDEIRAWDKERKPGEKPRAEILALPSRIITYMHSLIPPRRVDWDKLAECRQKKEESV